MHHFREQLRQADLHPQNSLTVSTGRHGNKTTAKVLFEFEVDHAVVGIQVEGG
jgi:hypothetical protein